jgi:hypothetical protein
MSVLFLIKCMELKLAWEAPGKICITQDVWLADTIKMGFQGVTAHWIEVKDGKWKMRGAVIEFKALSEAHDGQNLSRYTVELLDRVGIMDKEKLKVS